MNRDAAAISASDETTHSSPIHDGDMHDQRRRVRRQRLQDAIDSLKQLKEISNPRGFGGLWGESELGHLPPAA